MESIPNKKELLRLQLQAACRSSERLQVLTNCLAMAIDGIQAELVDVHDWSEIDAAVAVTDALQTIETGLLKEAVK